MLVDYVTRGVKAGLVAGLAFGLLVALVANPLVAFADEFGHEGETRATGDHREADTDGHHDGTTSGSHEGPAVSAAVTNGVSVVSGVLWGVLLGAVVFGAGFYFLEPAIPGTGTSKSYVLAAAGFVSVSGAPWLVFPPQPPGVEQALPAETRLPLYAGMVLLGALVCLLAGAVYGRLHADLGRIVAGAAALTPFGLLSVPVALSPSTAVTHSLPSGLATGLVGLVVLGQVLLWTVLAATYARLHRRATAERGSPVDADQIDSAVTAD
ncbi:CbtA family protein [Halosimplex salinum]|uniref:CbtA family protein n=1 Tax=Halosimplex salinum TaxID=1710538 RepID=UPI000F48541B|nr:CbtA family protein [Halosimplex salinum]